LRAIVKTPLVENKELAERMGRILAEAAVRQDRSQKEYRRVLTRLEKAHRRQDLDQAQRDATTLYGAAQTRQVHLFDLIAGMRLAEPLIAHDGQLILPADTVFDQDIIQRIFQLAAVRPVYNPVVILQAERK
jgi:hypothetical protein